jgi:FkbM family methyltransferase
MIDRTVRKILLKTLGDEKYLSLVSSTFLRMYHSGRVREKYPEMYLLNHFISEGDTCLDIGANLGYYTIPMVSLVGNSGKIYAVEPIEIFRKILNRNLKKYNLSNNVEIIPFALGDVDGEEMEMGTPEVNGLIHFGYTRILSSVNNRYKIKNTYKVKVYKPQTLFGNLKELHFIKCDIEGYEGKVIPGFLEIIKKYKPVLQIEILSEENRRIIMNMLLDLDYKVFYYFNGKLRKINSHTDKVDRNCDLYFLQSKDIAAAKNIIEN